MSAKPGAVRRLLRGNAVRGKQGLQRSKMLGALPPRWRASSDVKCSDGKCSAPMTSTVVKTWRR